MIEAWLQFTCDVCDETIFATAPDLTRAEFRQAEGITRVHGKDYCKQCRRRSGETAAGQFVVQTFVGGKLVGGKDGGYFTDDLPDARATLAMTIKRARRGLMCR